MRNIPPRLARVGSGIILLVCTFYYLRPASTESVVSGHEGAEISPKIAIRTAPITSGPEPDAEPATLIRIVDGQRASGPDSPGQDCTDGHQLVFLTSAHGVVRGRISKLRHESDVIGPAVPTH